jgi:hypothetical protein
MKLLQWIESKLVDDWRSGKRWLSAWGAGFGITFNVLAGALVKGISISVGFMGFVPLIWIPVIGCAIAALTLVARFVKQPLPKPKPDEFDDTDAAGC